MAEPFDNINAALHWAVQILSESSSSARLDAEILMAHALCMSRNDMLLKRDALSVPDNFTALVERRAAHEPIAYILGNQDFWDLTLKVTPDVLIPRPDSETIIEYLAQKYDATKPYNILDLGTGSGALILAALSIFPQAKGMGIDNSSQAISLAQYNAQENGLADRCEFMLMDWTDKDWQKALLSKFDIIISNPPYIATDEILMPDVMQFEPKSALFAGQEGLDDYRILIPQLQHLLSKNGTACLEIGSTQASDVSMIAAQYGYFTHIKQDLAGLDRMVVLEQKSDI